MAPALCGSIVQSKRGLLALGWSIVVLLTTVAFVVALIFTVNNNNYTENYNNYEDDNQDNNKNEQKDNNNAMQWFDDVEVAVTSRAMAFAAVWTAILAGIMAIFGTVVLGVQSPSGKYYWCCSGNVHATSPLSLGAFIGSLLMFANVTLVCSVLFGEFEIRDYPRGGNYEEAEEEAEETVEKSSMAFSVVCMFLTVLYAGFAALVFAFSDQLLEENRADARNEALSPSDPEAPPGYIGGDRFDVMGANPRKENSSGFIQPEQSHSDG